MQHPTVLIFSGLNDLIIILLINATEKCLSALICSQFTPNKGVDNEVDFEDEDVR